MVLAVVSVETRKVSPTGKDILDAALSFCPSVVTVGRRGSVSGAVRTLLGAVIWLV